MLRRGPENRVFRCPYRLENKVETSAVLLIERGAQTMSLPISMVSNSTIQQEDFDAWARECRKDSTNITSLSEAQEAATRMQRAHSCAPCQLPCLRDCVCLAPGRQRADTDAWTQMPAEHPQALRSESR